MNKIEYVKINPNQQSNIFFSDGEEKPARCLNCKNKKCIHYNLEEIVDEKVNMPININRDVCPVNAISINLGNICIDQSKCIKCGLCASRCINGAIYINESGYPIVSYGKTELKESDFEGVIKKGIFINETENLFSNIYNNIKTKNIDPNVFARNLLNQCGVKTILTRKGDVNLRMDGIIINNSKIGICEIEFGNDVLSTPRCLLDDIAVMCSRYDCKMEELLALVVSLNLPNNRTDFWRVIKDIKNVTDIKIQILSIGSLLLIMWNNGKINLNDSYFYLDCENNSLKTQISNVIKKEINIDGKFLSILETNK